MTYPVHFRKRIIAEAEKAARTIDVLRHYGISSSVFYAWKKKIQPKKGHACTFRSIDDQLLLNDVALYPDATQAERAARLNCSQSGICYALRRLKISYKKNNTTSAGR